MKVKALARTRSAIQILLLGAGLAMVTPAPFALAAGSHTDSKTSARDQFEQAVRMRTSLEGYLPRDRSLNDYKQTIAAYHKVYAISPGSEEATPSFIAEGELYEAMGRQFDPKYFQSAIEAYRFLLQQYPGSRYRSDALFAVAQIEKEGLNKPDDAEVDFKEFVRRYPKSDRASAARQSLREIADNRAKDSNPVATAAVPASVTPPAPTPSASSATSPPATVVVSAPMPAPVAVSALPTIKGQAVAPQEAAGRTPFVKQIQTFNAGDSARIVVTLGDTVAFKSALIHSPDRIYVDMEKAHLDPAMARKPIAINDGLLKSVRVAQNRPDTVRVVLDANGAKNYTATLLSSPYRLVIEVQSQDQPQVQPQPIQTVKAAAPAVFTPPAKSAALPVENAKVAETVVVSSSAPAAPTSQPAAKPPVKVVAKAAPTKAIDTKPFAMSTTLQPPPQPRPMHDGQQSLTRELGLKISRIVIDAGHGGHDTGTIGPHGLMEKDLCLDVALRLGKLIEQKMPGAQVIYTRKDDTFIPLGDRTAIANEAKADLFISIHANSSHDPDARGIETYYLNFSSSPDAVETAARENANSQESIHDLQDIIRQIARNDKIEESKELAGDVQDSLTQRLQLVSRDERNRGVKKAPFVVLIGADMPSILSEISFVSNPSDERLLRKTDQRQRIADGLLRGITSYLDSLNSLSNNKQKLVSDNHPEGTALASTGNPK
jgi:N-acetylmuramoyl-L-alanine amidase